MCLDRLYVDGRLAGQLSVNSTLPDGTSVPSVDGGAATAMTGPIVLCSRSDGDPARYFDGSIAQLGEWCPSLCNSHKGVKGRLSS